MNIKFKNIVLILSILFVFLILGCSNVYASEASISATSPNVGGNVTVTVNFPADCYGYEGTIIVAFADGTTVSSWEADADLNGNSMQPLTFSTKANVVGSGYARMTGLVLSSKDATQLNSQTTIETTFTVSCSHNYSDWTTQSHNPAVQERTCSVCRKVTYRETPGYTPPVKNTVVNTITNTVKNEVKNEVKNTVTNTVNNTVTNAVANTVNNTVKNETQEEEIVVTIKRELKTTMYVDPEVSSCNVRNADSTKGKIVGGLKSGDEVQVTGITSNGWYRIKYGSGVAYVYDEALTEEEPEEVENEVTNNTVNNMVNNTTDNVVENIEDDNFENEIDILENTIGVIPEVGNNITNVLFIVVTIISLGYVFYLSYKNREV